MKYEAVIYFDNPISRWQQQAPAENEILCRRRFRWRVIAEAWAAARLQGFSYCNFAVEVVDDAVRGG